MSRFNYTEDEDFSGQFAMWEANTNRCLQGKNGQKALRDFRDALVAMPEKRLIAELLYDESGVCAIGAYGRHVGVDLSTFDPEDATDEAGQAMGLPYRIAWKLVEMNDMEFDHCAPEERYAKMLSWVDGQLKSAIVAATRKIGD
jgi:hypothetical protein